MRRLESPESSSPLVTRSVACALRDQFCGSYSFPIWQRIALEILGLLPHSIARRVMEQAQFPMALDPTGLGDNLPDDLIQERLNDYANLSGPFPAIMLGVPVGGAAAHLAVSIGAPFLPQAFVLTIRGGALDGDVQEYFQRSDKIAQRIVDASQEVMTVQHYDPVHDGWLTRRVNHLRLKLVALPEAYIRFIRQKLIPGGDVIYLEGRALWPRYRLAERRIFQVGGWGGISPEEYLAGSPRLERYCRTIGLTNTDWRLKNYPLEVGPESEWGSESGLAEALEKFCQQEGYHFHLVTFPRPNDFSKLAFYAMTERLRRQNRPPAGILVEIFSQYDVTSVERLGFLPIWLTFNTEDSRQYLESMLTQIDHALPFYFSALSTFSITPDMVTWKSWEKTFSRVNWLNIGARKTHYPADIRAILNWANPLRSLSCGLSASLPYLRGVDLKNLADKYVTPFCEE